MTYAEEAALGNKLVNIGLSYYMYVTNLVKKKVKYNSHPTDARLYLT